MLRTAAGHSWYLAPQYIVEHFRVVLPVFEVSAPTNQRGFPSVLHVSGR